jgi:hypothetical protein
LELQLAVIEISETLVIVLKLFQLKRFCEEENIIREGFFPKTAEWSAR